MKNYDRVIRLLKDAMGERTLRKYALDADIYPGTLSKIMNGNYEPSIKILEKLTSDKASPRNGVTLNDLLIAAGYKIDLGITQANPSIDEEGEKKRKERRLAEEQYKTIVMGLIYSSLAVKGIPFSPVDARTIDSSRFRPDFAVNLGDDLSIDTWWFVTKKNRPDSTLRVSYHAEQLIGRAVLIPSDSKRKISFVVEDIELFKALKDFHEKNSYRGNLSVILVDTKNVKVIEEEPIAYYDPTDIDGIPKITD